MAKVAKALGYKNASSYQRYENPELFTKPHLPLPLVRALVDILVGKGKPAITKAEVMMLAGLHDLTTPQLQSLDEQSWVWCVGEAAAGTWREAFEWPRDDWLPVAIAVKDERYPGAKRSALRVRGDSMDQLYPDGSFVVFVRLADLGRKAQQGDRVVVIRRRHGLMEATIKEYFRDGKNKRWLVPRSTNPAHAALPLEKTADDSEEIDVIGLVVGSQRVE